MLNSIFNTAILCCANIVCQCYAYNEVKFRLNKLNVSYKTGTEKYYCLILTTLAVLYLSLNQLSLIQSIIVIVFYAFLTLMACIDLLSFLLPRLYTVTFIFSGLLYQAWNNNILSGLFCAILMFFIMLFVRLYFAYKNGTESFGMGDVLLIAGTGVWFPTPEIACSIVFIAVIGGIIFFTLGGLNKQKKYIPFGPFLCGGMFVYSLVPGILF